MFRMAGLDTGLKLVDPYLDAPDTPLRLLALANVAGFVAAASNNGMLFTAHFPTCHFD